MDRIDAYDICKQIFDQIQEILELANIRNSISNRIASQPLEMFELIQDLIIFLAGWILNCIQYYYSN